MYDFIHSYN